MSPARKRSRRTARRVALLIETSNSYSRKLLRGVRSYMQHHGPWSIQFAEQARGNRPPDWLARWKGDGIIARIETEEIATAVRATGLPVVNVSATSHCPEFPRVISDSAEIARLAVEHLSERGFRDLAYCGDDRFIWSGHHEANFADHVARLGGRCSVYRERQFKTANLDREKRGLIRWIQSLPRPVGIMACYDLRGRQILDVCRELGIRVPDEVAVIGQHNDDLLCDLCDPPLTSVIPNPEKSGFDAAGLLDRMMSGRRVRPVTMRTAPLGVATRMSTDVVAVDDERLRRALRFIHDHRAEPITVDSILGEVPMSRTLLETSFKELIGTTPYRYILRIRTALVKELLLRKELSVARVAERCGFENTEYLSVVFKRETGMTPREFRSRHLA